MKTRVKIFAWGVALLFLATACAYAQQNSDSSSTSLGDIARQLKAQKAKEPKPVMVITNDNIYRSKDDSSGFNAGTPAKKPVDKAPEVSSGSAQNHDEKYYRTRLGELQSQLETHQRELSALQQKLGQNQMQYYPDPNKTLQQEYSRGDIDKLTAEIDAKKQQVTDDEKAIDDLHDQLRREGGDPGWLR